MDRSTIKAVRVAALIHAREQGLLEGRSLNEIARVLAGEGEAPVNRSTILRNLRDLDDAIELRNRLVERLRNLEKDECPVSRLAPHRPEKQVGAKHLIG